MPDHERVAEEIELTARAAIEDGLPSENVRNGITMILRRSYGDTRCDALEEAAVKVETLFDDAAATNIDKAKVVAATLISAAAAIRELKEGAPAFSVPRRWRCKDCGAEWEEVSFSAAKEET
jgi:hypothetical protein